MSWNYRIFRHRERYAFGGKKRHTTYYALHETYYFKNGKVKMWTEKPVSPTACTVRELIAILEMQLSDVKKSRGDVLDYKNDKRK